MKPEIEANPSSEAETERIFEQLTSNLTASQTYAIPEVQVQKEGIIETILASILNVHPILNDIWLTENESPVIRDNGKVQRLQQIPAISTSDLKKWLETFTVLPLVYNQDTAYVLKAQHKRFRVNVYMQRGILRVCMRLINQTVPTYKALGIPDSVTHKFCQLKDGLVLFCGATGSGKSSSISSIIQERAVSKDEHILTLEDPIEYEFADRMSFFSQRELGKDFCSFSEGLKNALREAPNTIYVGEIRDKETAEMALHAAETGHLVVSTLHTRRAHLGINRYVLQFPPEQAPEIYSILSTVLKLVVCQRLVPSTNGGRVALYEVMHNTEMTRPLILQGKINQLDSILDHGGAIDNFSFLSHANKLLQNNLISKLTFNDICASLDSKQKQTVL